jgi:hypothetical protein
VLPGIFIFAVMKKKINLRSMAAQAVEQVVEQGQSLSNVLPPLQQKSPIKTKHCCRSSALASCEHSRSWTGLSTS